eukprot:g57031.t1
MVKVVEISTTAERKSTCKGTSSCVAKNTRKARPCQSMRVVVINLKRRAERLQHMEALARELGLQEQMRVFEALDGKALGEEQLRQYAADTLGIAANLTFAQGANTLGSQALLLSVTTVLLEFLASNDSAILVMEDDQLLGPVKRMPRHTVDCTRSGLAEAAALIEERNVAMIWLGYTFVSADVELQESAGRHGSHRRLYRAALMSANTFVVGTGALVYSRAAAERVVAEVRRDPNNSLNIVLENVLAAHSDVRDSIWLTKPALFEPGCYEFESDLRTSADTANILLLEAKMKPSRAVQLLLQAAKLLMQTFTAETSTGERKKAAATMVKVHHALSSLATVAPNEAASLRTSMWKDDAPETIKLLLVVCLASEPKTCVPLGLDLIKALHRGAAADPEPFDFSKLFN